VAQARVQAQFATPTHSIALGESMLNTPDGQKLVIAAAVLMLIGIFFLAAWINRIRRRASKNKFADLLTLQTEKPDGLHSTTGLGRGLIGLIGALFLGIVSLTCLLSVWVELAASGGASWVNIAVLTLVGSAAGWFARALFHKNFLQRVQRR
jgi:Flp pilus assembly protein TadB